MNSAQQKPGTRDLGREYELIMAARTTLLLLLDPNIFNFKIITNDDSYGDFDDVVASVMFEDGREQTIAVQMKYKEKANKSFQAASVEASKGDFSIESYYQSYETKIGDRLKEKCQFVLYTNASFKGQQRLQRFETLSSESCPGAFLLKTGDQGEIYSFKEKEKSRGDDAMSGFLQSFSLYCNQSSLGELQVSTKGEFMASLNCGEEGWLKYLDFFRALFNGDYAPPTLSRDEILFQIMYSSLRSFVVEFHERHDETIEFIKRLASSCDIVVVPNYRKCVTKGIENETEAVDKDFIKQAKKSKLLKNCTQMKNVTKEDVFRSRWYLGNETPLIVLDADSTEPALTMIERLFDRPTKRHKFVLIADIPRPKFRHLSVIRDLGDIKRKNETLYLEEILKYDITLQGRSNIPLGELFDIVKEDDLDRLFTVGDVLRMRQGLLAIGKSNCPRPTENCIERDLLIQAVSHDILVPEVLKHSLVILVNTVYVSRAGIEVMTIEGFLGQSDVKNRTQILVEADINVAWERFQDIRGHLIRNSDKRNVYLFIDVDGGGLALVCSCGSIEILREYLLCDQEICFPERFAVVMASSRGTFVVCAKPGMGKTVFINRFAAQCPVDFWVVQVALREHVNFFKNLPECEEDILRYFSGASYEKDDLISESVAAKFGHQKNIIFLFDALDELPSHCVNAALQCMKVVSKSGFRQVVTSRNNMKQLLEENLQLLTEDLADICVKYQDRYIRGRLEGKFSKNVIEKMVTSLRENRTIVRNNDILGVPLQLHMLSEIMLNSKKEAQVIDESDFLLLTNMYEQFFIGKFEHFQVKTDVNTEKILPYIDGTTAHRARMYQIAALTSCFDAEHLNIIESFLGSFFAEGYKEDCDTFFKQFSKEGDPFGVIDRLVDGSVVYAHQTFAEYFTAVFLSKYCSKCFQLKHFIFEEKYDNIRLMFDMLLAKRCPGHIAVLYRDLEKFRSLPEHIKRMKDEGGRNALHLLSSWGYRYNFREIEISQKSNGVIYWTFDNSMEMKVRKKSKPDLLMQELLTRFDCTKKDKLYRWSAISYAEKVMSLSVLDEIAGKSRISVEVLRDSADKYRILVCSILGDFWNLFRMIDIRKLPYITKVNKLRDIPLLDLITQYATPKYVKLLLENPIYKRLLNTNTVVIAIVQRKIDWVKVLLEESTLVELDYDSLFRTLFSLTFEKYTFEKELADLLLSMGADINSQDGQGNSPLLLACSVSNLEAVRYLLEKGSDITATNNYNQNVLMLASANGNLELVQFLFEHGSFDPLQKRMFNKVSAMSHAISSGHIGVVKYFVNEKKCNMTTLANDKEYLLNLAKDNNRPEIEEFLADALSTAEGGPV